MKPEAILVESKLYSLQEAKMIETNICFKQILFPLEGKLMLIEAMFVTHATTLFYL
jgi:hypothetical protein